MSYKLYKRIYRICNDYNGKIRNEDMEFVRDQRGIITTYLKEQTLEWSVFRVDGKFYNHCGYEMPVLVDDESLGVFEFMFDGKAIRQLTPKQYETLFLPF